MFDLKTMDQVMEIIHAQFCNYDIGTEGLGLPMSVDRIIADTIFSSEDIPGFNRSMVDGFAVISSDTFGANESMPVQLTLLPEIKMGENPDFSLRKGQAAPIPTGGELPLNADSVVMVEHSYDLQDGFIYLNNPSAPGNKVIYKGDDVKKGSLILEKGQRIRPQEMGVLAAMGSNRVTVFKKPKIGIISTGDEIVDILESTQGGARIRDINSYTLYAGILNAGCEPIQYGIIKDQSDQLFAAMKKAFYECDAVLISGGSSVGVRDKTYQVIEMLSKTEDLSNSISPSITDDDTPGILVHGIAVKPGKPTIIGKVAGKAIIGLPGHPVSAIMIFRIVVVPLLRLLKKEKLTFEYSIEAFLKTNYPSNHGCDEYVPVKIESSQGKTYAVPVFGKSGLITSLILADGFFHISRGLEGVSKDDKVKILLF